MKFAVVSIWEVTYVFSVVRTSRVIIVVVAAVLLDSETFDYLVAAFVFVMAVTAV